MRREGSVERPQERQGRRGKSGGALCAADVTVSRVGTSTAACLGRRSLVSRRDAVGELVMVLLSPRGTPPHLGATAGESGVAITRTTRGVRAGLLRRLLRAKSEVDRVA